MVCNCNAFSEIQCHTRSEGRKSRSPARSLAAEERVFGELVGRVVVLEKGDACLGFHILVIAYMILFIIYMYTLYTVSSVCTQDVLYINCWSPAIEHSSGVGPFQRLLLVQVLTRRRTLR